jgi:hypothetical protein
MNDQFLRSKHWGKGTGCKTARTYEEHLDVLQRVKAGMNIRSTPTPSRQLADLLPCEAGLTCCTGSNSYPLIPASFMKGKRLALQPGAYRLHGLYRQRKNSFGR